MKKSIYVSLIIFFILLFTVSFYFVKMNAYADDNDENNNDGTCTNPSALYKHYDISSDNDPENKKITITIDKGSFIVTHLESSDLYNNGSILNTNVSARSNFTDDGYTDRSFDHIAIENEGVYKDVFSGDDLVLYYNGPGTIKIGLAYFSKSRDKADDVTGCYSFDADSDKPKFQTYFEKMKPNKDNADELVGTGEMSYIEISIPGTVSTSLKNSNYDGLCNILRIPNYITNENYPDFKDYKDLLLGDSQAARENYYKDYLNYCWEENVAYNYDEESLSKIIKNIIDVVYKVNRKSSNDIEPKGFMDFKAGSEEVSSPNLDNLYCEYEKFDNISNAYTYNDNIHDKNYEYNINANVKKKYYKNPPITKSATYNYTFTSGETSSATKNVCSVDCEEVIEIKYGPPVASVAGMCFEYEVEAKSMVNCKTKIIPGGKPDPGKYCSPIPYCNSYPGYVHQGGPNDSFDKCINDCDGGKYSKECSEKCYKNIYSPKSSKVSFSNSNSSLATKVGSGDPFSIQNGKYMYVNGAIVWRGVNDTSKAPGYARYYLENEYYRTYYNHGQYLYDINGFKRMNYGYSLCSDNCYFSGCNKYTYLNKSELQSDLETNMEIYNKKLDECAASATCSTKTAKFTIKINYKTDEVESSSTEGNSDSTTTEDGLKSAITEDELYSSSNGACNNDLGKKNNVVKKFDGCYKKCDTSTKQYMTRWGTQGTWFNIKTDEISYSSSKPNESWYQEKNRFCLARSQKTTNLGWWNYYYSLNKYSDDEKTKYQNELNKCDSTIGKGKYLNANKSDIGDISWNITASTDGFGYSGWKFNVKCFYAVISCSKDYKIRTFDGADMFPNESGDILDDTNKVSRNTGFNWSTDSVSTAKNPLYPIDPKGLIAKTQNISKNTENGIYDDEYLDYKVVLTSQGVSNIRKLNLNYTDIRGKYEVDPGTGILRYYSNFLGKKTIGTSVIDGIEITRPNDELLKCNNIDKDKCLSS